MAVDALAHKAPTFRPASIVIDAALSLPINILHPACRSDRQPRRMDLIDDHPRTRVVEASGSRPVSCKPAIISSWHLILRVVCEVRQEAPR